ncbi:MAG: hypothetical protein ACI8Z5_000067 [Lentimonas sp.]|jgi:hypothetical protein
MKNARWLICVAARLGQGKVFAGRGMCATLGLSSAMFFGSRRTGLLFRITRGINTV